VKAFGSAALAMLASASVAAVVAVLVSSIFFTARLRSIAAENSNEIGTLTTRLIEIERNVETTGNQLETLQARVAQTTDLTLATVGPDARVIHLMPQSAAPSAAGNVALNRTEGAAMLEVSGLPPTPDEQQYEVWWVGQQKGPLKAGSFEPLSQGATIVSLDLPPPGEVVLGSEITLESRGGAEKPSGAMYLKGEFPRR
jgi:hypothetical protein